MITTRKLQPEYMVEKLPTGDTPGVGENVFKKKNVMYLKQINGRHILLSLSRYLYVFKITTDDSLYNMDFADS